MGGEVGPRGDRARGGEAVCPGDGGGRGVEAALVAPNKKRRLQARRVGRRKLFDAKARKVFLGWFAGTGNLSWAAKEAGVHYRTVLRHRMEDAGFREAYDLAEAQSVPRLRAWLAQAKEEEAAGLAAAADGDGEEEAGGDPAPENLSVDQAIRLVEGWEKRQAALLRLGSGFAGGGGGVGFGPVGPGQGRGLGRVPTVASNAEVRDALVKRLRAFGIRTVAERAAVAEAGAGAEGPLHHPSGGHDRVPPAPGCRHPFQGNGGPIIPRSGEDL